MVGGMVVCSTSLVLLLLSWAVNLMESNRPLISASRYVSRIPREIKCGVQPLKTSAPNFLEASSRIIGGEEAAIGGQPWTVSIQYQSRHICGGSIVGSTLVVTVAHCIYPASRERVARMVVVAGEYDQTVPDPQQQDIPITSVRLHPQYRNDGSMRYDVALIYLARPIAMGSEVQPVCLPQAGESFAVGTLCISSGWGRIGEGGEMSHVLQEVKLPILDDEACSSALEARGLPSLHKSMVCAGFPDGGKDACQGDSGGPLVCQRRSGAWVLFGSSSWGLGCGRAWGTSMTSVDLMGSPAIYTKMSSLLDFLRDSTADDKVKAPHLTQHPDIQAKRTHTGECGVAPLSAQWLLNRIVGGEEACPSCWPWHVALKFRGTFVCGGAIISPTWVLTAAHCLLSPNLSHYEIVAGIHDRSLKESSEQKQRLEAIAAHENFTLGDYDYDIALLHVAEPFMFNNFVRPVCLVGMEESIEPSSLCVVTGWGNTQEVGEMSGRLQQLQVPIISNEVCNTTYYPGLITDRMLCAGFPDAGGKDSCQGDSGGPLVCPSVDNSYVLYGIISWGLGCARAKKPGVYARVRLFLNWIQDTLQGRNRNVIRKRNPQNSLANLRAAECPSGVELTDSVGSIASPGYPDGYPAGLNCSWTIVSDSPSNVIRLDVEQQSIEESENCTTDSLSVYQEGENGSKLLGKTCGFQSMPMTYRSLGPKIQVVFISSEEGTHSKRGFVLTFKIYGGQVRPFSEVTEVTGFRNPEICSDRIETADGGAITSPGYPDHYPNDLRCVWRIIGPLRSVVRVDVDRLNTEKDGAGCRDVLLLYDGVGESKALLGSLCGNVSRYSLKSRGSEMMLAFTTDSSGTMAGFTLRYSFWRRQPEAEERAEVQTAGGCSNLDVVSPGSADLRSPGYPSTYTNGLDCWWTLNPVSGIRPQILIIDLALEDSPNCVWDALHIYHGAGNQTQLLDTLCGRLSNLTLRSGGGKVTLHFHTDLSVGSRGFHLRYSDVTAERSRSREPAEEQDYCGRTLVDPMPRDKPVPVSRMVMDERGTTRVIGGQAAAAKSWPWIVSLQDKRGRHYCGATIIHKKWLLTAAHCRFLVGSDRVVAGVTDLAQPSLTEAIVIRTIVPDLYEAEVIPPEHDIRLLELATPLVVGDTVGVMCLPGRDELITDSGGCLIAGWGVAKGSGNPTLLQQARVPLVSREQCLEFWGADVTEGNLCAGAAGASSCVRDSGGPLICKQGDKYKLLGVVSWGSNFCDPETPAVYTSLAKYRDWIQRHTQQSV